ncbi:MAG: 6-phospho-alpha-glucosidase [Fusobacteriia bacterium 4572_74]|nr:MAG: 6-phospho-alpha-glucosidase [Fusobacteriia bacterium 4572_74]
MESKFNIVLVGGGSTWTPGILKAICKKKGDFPLAKIVLYDVDENRQEPIGQFGEILFKEDYPECEFIYTTDKKVAFTEMDYVFCQMRTGGYTMRELDEKIPLTEGVVGQETCGPGGFAYGMRSIRDMIALVNDVRSIILNICDQPVNLLRSYGRLLNIDPNELEPVYFGLNHFGWFTNLYNKDGVDMVPKLKEIITSKGFIPVDAEQRDQSWLDTYSMVRDMLVDFPEYLPNTYLQYYLYPEYKAAKLDSNYTRANEVMDGREKRVFEECRAAVKAGTTKLSSVVHNDAHGDMIVEVAESIAYNKNKTYIVIMQNNGLIENIPNDAMVEVAASLGINGPKPYGVGKVDTFYKAMIENQFAYERLTVEAYFEGSYNKALKALTLNRTVIDAKKARRVLDKLIEANKDYWPALV